jgi:hypothetical protein
VLENHRLLSLREQKHRCEKPRFFIYCAGIAVAPFHISSLAWQRVNQNLQIERK